MKDPILEALNYLTTEEIIVSKNIDNFNDSINEIEKDLEGGFPCPRCGNLFTGDSQICHLCNFNLSELVKCPYKENSECSINKNNCDIEGFDYEICETFRELKR